MVGLFEFLRDKPPSSTILLPEQDFHAVLGGTCKEHHDGRAKFMDHG